MAGLQDPLPAGEIPCHRHLAKPETLDQGGRLGALTGPYLEHKPTSLAEPVPRIGRDPTDDIEAVAARKEGDLGFVVSDLAGQSRGFVSPHVGRIGHHEIEFPTQPPGHLLE